MSQTLYCEFVVSPDRGQVYWWPLIFDVMCQHSFVFAHPEKANGVGDYFYIRLDDPGQSDGVSKPFRAFWEEVYAERSQLLVLFWSQGEDPFPLKVSLSWDKEEQLLHVTLSLQGGELRGCAFVEARERLLMMLNCAKALYDLCQPLHGEIYWESAGYNYAPWASFGQPLPEPSAERRALEPRDKKRVRQVLSDRRYLELVEPVPLPKSGGGWLFLSLFGP